MLGDGDYSTYKIKQKILHLFKQLEKHSCLFRFLPKFKFLLQMIG